MNLEYLNICNYDGNPTYLVNAAIEITKKRTNNVILKIDVNRYNIDFERIIDKFPLLHS